MQLQQTAVTQRVYPTEVYPGYLAVNESRRSRGQWSSTGEGVQSFRGRVVEADAAERVTFQFSYLNHLRFAELGVGAGTKAEDVEREKKAYYTRRYIRRWDRSQSRGRASSHRPFIYMELRHLATRASDFLLDHFGYEADFRTLDILDGMQLDLSVT